LVKALGMSSISQSQVSRLCEEIDERVKAFLARPIEGDWPYVWIDATYLRVRRAGRIVSVAVTIAVGVNGDGRREVLGMAIGASEAETFWIAFLRGLARRGLRGVKLVISDAHEGIKAAVSRVFSASWQRCQVHFSRNALAHGAGRNDRDWGALLPDAVALNKWLILTGAAVQSPAGERHMLVDSRRKLLGLCGHSLATCSAAGSSPIPDTQ
jgi:putative transposase